MMLSSRACVRGGLNEPVSLALRGWRASESKRCFRCSKNALARTMADQKRRPAEPMDQGREFFATRWQKQKEPAGNGEKPVARNAGRVDFQAELPQPAGQGSHRNHLGVAEIVVKIQCKGPSCG